MNDSTQKVMPHGREQLIAYLWTFWCVELRAHGLTQNDLETVVLEYGVPIEEWVRGALTWGRLCQLFRARLEEYIADL